MSLFSRSPWDPPSLLERIFTTPVQFLLTSLYRIFTRLHSSPRILSSASPSKIRVVCISDTHSQTYSIPDGDVLIHAGDMTRRGTVQELQALIDWMESLPHTYKIAIAGNHDTYLDPSSRKTLAENERTGEVDWKSVRYLQHSGTALEFNRLVGEGAKKRMIKVYGAPQVPRCGGPDNAFQYERSQDAWTDTVPTSIDILVTHTPPKYHLDLQHPSLGCEHLLREVRRVKPKLHVFGHVHSGAGRELVWWDDMQTVYEVGMARASNGFFRQILDVGLWMDLLRVAVAGVSSVVWDRIWGGEHAHTLMVNAALMYRNTGVLRNPVQVTDI